MSLIFMESFDGIATADLPLRGWTPANASSFSVSSAQARTGANSLLCSSTLRYATKGVPAADEHQTFIAGCAVRATLGGGNLGLFTFRSDLGSTDQVTIAVSITGAIVALRGNASATVIGSSSAGAIASDTWNYVEAKATMHDTTGAVEARVNGATVLTLTNVDTKGSGSKTVFDSVAMGNNGTASSGPVYIDDVYVCNSAGSANNNFIGDSRVRLLLPDGNGNSTQLVGSDGNSVDNYLLIDESPPSTVDFVGSGVDNQKDTYTFTNLPDATGTVVGVQKSALGLKTDAGSRSVALVTRTGGADYDSPDLALPTPNPIFVFDVDETNPGTGVAWLRAEVNAAEFGVKIRP